MKKWIETKLWRQRPQKSKFSRGELGEILESEKYNILFSFDREENEELISHVKSKFTKEDVPTLILLARENQFHADLTDSYRKENRNSVDALTATGVPLCHENICDLLPLFNCYTNHSPTIGQDHVANLILSRPNLYLEPVLCFIEDEASNYWIRRFSKYNGINDVLNFVIRPILEEEMYGVGLKNIVNDFLFLLLRNYDYDYPIEITSFLVKYVKEFNKIELLPDLRKIFEEGHVDDLKELESLESVLDQLKQDISPDDKLVRKCTCCSRPFIACKSSKKYDNLIVKIKHNFEEAKKCVNLDDHENGLVSINKALDAYFSEDWSRVIPNFPYRIIGSDDLCSQDDLLTLRLDIFLALNQTDLASIDFRTIRFGVAHPFEYPGYDKEFYINALAEFDRKYLPFFKEKGFFVETKMGGNNNDEQHHERMNHYLSTVSNLSGTVVRQKNVRIFDLETSRRKKKSFPMMAYPLDGEIVFFFDDERECLFYCTQRNPKFDSKVKNEDYYPRRTIITEDFVEYSPLCEISCPENVTHLYAKGPFLVFQSSRMNRSFEDTKNDIIVTFWKHRESSKIGKKLLSLEQIGNVRDIAITTLDGKYLMIISCSREIIIVNIFNGERSNWGRISGQRFSMMEINHSSIFVSVRYGIIEYCIRSLAIKNVFVVDEVETYFGENVFVSKNYLLGMLFHTSEQNYRENFNLVEICIFSKKKKLVRRRPLTIPVSKMIQRKVGRFLFLSSQDGGGHVIHILDIEDGTVHLISNWYNRVTTPFFRNDDSYLRLVSIGFKKETLLENSPCQKERVIRLYLFHHVMNNGFSCTMLDVRYLNERDEVIVRKEKKRPRILSKDTKYCRGCGKSKGIRLSKCSRCKKTFYCSVECQRIDWKKHKPECASLRCDGQVDDEMFFESV